MEHRCSSSERHFSIELKSKCGLKNITLANHSHENVLIEGTIGELTRIEFTEDILEIVGSKGTLTINIAQNEIPNLKRQT